MRTTIVLLAAALAACATNPAEIRALGMTYTFNSPRAPEQAAACIVRNAQDNSLIGTTRPGPGGSTEVLIVSPSAAATLLVVEVTRSEAGSVMTHYTSDNVLMRQTLSERMGQGC